MFFGDMIARIRLNMDLYEKETGSYMSKDERMALKRAKEAEHAFRVSKGYETENIKDKIIKKFRHN